MKNIKNYIIILGLLSILVSLIAWTADYTGMVYACPYCRVQRTVIGVLGLAMVLPNYKSLLYIFGLGLSAFFAAVIAVEQNFMGWKKISNGDFQGFQQPVYENAFLLSAGAFILISAQFIILFMRRFPHVASLLK